MQVHQPFERANTPDVWQGWADVNWQRFVHALEQVVEIGRDNLWSTGGTAGQPQYRCVSRSVGASRSSENAVDCLVHLVAPVFLMKQVEDSIQVLRSIALLEEATALGSRAGA